MGRYTELRWRTRFGDARYAPFGRSAYDVRPTPKEGGFELTFVADVLATEGPDSESVFLGRFETAARAMSAASEHAQHLTQETAHEQ